MAAGARLGGAADGSGDAQGSASPANAGAQALRSSETFTPLSRIPHLDPQRMAVIGVDRHLPAVSPERLHEQALRERFTRPPIWTPEFVREPRFAKREPTPAAVLVGLVQRPQGPTVLLTRRTDHLSTHSGQIAFAGGKIDADDRDATAAALREADEEIGLASRHIDVIGELPTYVTGTAFTITPVVALVRPGFTLSPNPGEVAEAFEVPLAFLMNPANHRRHAIDWEGVRREWLSMPWQDERAREYLIWGATAGMLRNLYRLLSA